MTLSYRVGDIREAGLQAKWTRVRGRPIIAARKTDNDKWFVVDAEMWKRVEQVGMVEAFTEHTLLGDIFSIKV